MADQPADLNLLAVKLKREIKSLEDQLAEAKRRYGVISEAVSMLTNEGYIGQEPLFVDRPAISQKYKGKPLVESIEDILKLASGQSLTVENILVEINSNGFESGSKNLKRDVYTYLHRLAKRKRISMRKEGKLNKYFIKDVEGGL
jgi:hypothetical protein